MSARPEASTGKMGPLCAVAQLCELNKPPFSCVACPRDFVEKLTKIGPIGSFLVFVMLEAGLYLSDIDSD